MPRRRTRPVGLSHAPKMRRTLPHKRKGAQSKQPFNEAAKAAGVSFELSPTWKYDYHRPVIRGGFTPTSVVHTPHLVLRDRKKIPRFTLAYQDYPNGIVIWAIQRELSQYKHIKEYGREGYVHDIDTERAATLELKKELGGIHPSEYMVLQFLWINRDQLGNKPIYIRYRQPTDSLHKQYAGVYERLFEKKPTYFDVPADDTKIPLPVLRLAINKERVKKIIERDSH